MNPLDPVPSPDRIDKNPLLVWTPRRAVLSCVVVLGLGFVCYKTPSLMTELVALQIDQANSHASIVVGYPEINPNPSYAKAPEDWYLEEENHARLWSNWEHGVGHRWYEFAVGDLKAQALRGRFGRDAVRAIDLPLIEVGGGTYWERIPDDHRIAAARIEGVPCGYPVLVMEKVEIINDQIGTQPYLILSSPSERLESRFTVHEAVVDGQRVTMGHAGYFLGRRALLYDRGTESLWIAEDQGLVCLAGPRKGTRLRRLATLEVAKFGTWCASFARDGRLVVGADRSQGIPLH